MERLDRIFTILIMLALVAVLVWHHQPEQKIPVGTDDGLNQSAQPSWASGPAIYVANLPPCRISDDYADPVSYYFSENIRSAETLQ